MNPARHKKSEKFVVGLDCSTTATKAIAFDHRGAIVAQARVAIPLSSPQPRYYEQNSDDWWLSTRQALRTLTRQIPPEDISAIGVSNQRETFVPLDENGKALRPAIVWLDERCKDEVEPFSAKIGRERIHRITGKPPDYAPVVYRLAWMKRHESRLYRKIDKICDVHAYIVWKLTDSFKTSWASADPFGAFDLQRKQWSNPILAALKLSIDQFPQIFSPGTILGNVSVDAARVTGLCVDTLVVAGGGDGQAAGLGTNALSPERAYLNLGTAVVAGVYGRQYRTNKAFRTMCSCSDRGYYYECSLRSGTFALDWFVRQILNIDPLTQTDIYRVLEREARSVSAGSDGLLFLPYICGAMNPYWDPNARGAFVGLTSAQVRGHMYRSILEGIAFEQRLAIEAVERNSGIAVKEFVAIGGGATNALWCHILADATGRDVCIPKNTEASALGAAMASAVGVGWYRTFNAAAEAMSCIKKTTRPNRRHQTIYENRFIAYKKIYPNLSSIIKTI